jgi:tetratricopeptide (TPR) repeat protein
MSAVIDEARLEARQSEGLSEWICRRFGWFILGLATTIAYSNTFLVPFVFDGTNYIVDNAELRDLSKPKQILKFSPTRAVGYYSFALNYALAKKISANGDGYEPYTWHIVNLLIHIGAACAIWGLARRALQSPKLGGRYTGASEQLALAMALVWAVHPLCTQAVTYLYQRVESLMGLLLLLTIYSTARFAACQERLAATRGGPWGGDDAGGAPPWSGSGTAPETAISLRLVVGLCLWPALAVLFCLTGMATKETMLVAPIVAVWYDRVFIARSWRELFSRRALLYGALFATWTLLWYLMQLTKYDEAGINDHRHDTRWTYFLNETRVILHYFKLVFVPWGQNLDYAWLRVVDIGNESPKDHPTYLLDTLKLTSLSLAAVTALGGATLIAIVQRPALGFLAASVFIGLAPTSSFAVIIDLCFEHRMYVPLMAMVPLVVVLAYEAIGLAGRWINSLYDRGQGEPGSGDETASCLRISLAWLTVAVLIALTLRRNRDYESHVSIWADAFAKAPHNARACYNQGVFLQNDGRMEEAIAQYKHTLELRQEYDGAHLNLANVYAWQATTTSDPAQRAKLLADAEYHYGELLRYLPGDERGLYGMADVLRQSRRYAQAEEYVDQLLSVNPNHEQGKTLKLNILYEQVRATATPSSTVPGDGK